MPSIRPLPFKVDVGPAVAQIDEHPEFWDRYTTRTASYGSPHDVSDIWVRYNDWRKFRRAPEKFNDEHESVWYPCITVLWHLLPIISGVYHEVGGMQLGGVLITRIRPNGEVRPHRDAGWHASHYQKYAVQLKGNADQCFHFVDSKLSPLPGDVYTFDNSHTHWVTNDSKEDRMTLIICIRSIE